MNDNQNMGPDLSQNNSFENQQAYTNAQDPQYQQQDSQQQNYQQPNYQSNYQQPPFQQPPFQQPMPPQPPVGYNQKSKVAAGLLGIFLGCFGVHNFYLGYTGKAVAQLLITLLTCFLASPISSVWGLIEGIMILANSNPVDANGVPLAN